MSTTSFTKLISLMAYDAALTERTDDYYLRVKTMPQTIDLHAVARETALRLGKNEDEVYTLLNAAEEVKCDALSSGYIVSTPTALMQPGASGTVLRADLSQAPDRDKVKVYASLSMGPRLRQSMNECQLEIFTQPAVVGPLLNGAQAQTRSANGTTTTRAPQPGKNIGLTGKNIKLAGTDPTVGVTFTSVDTPSKKVFVPMEDVTVNEPKRLIFVLPAEVTDGLWNVSVTTQYSSGGGTVKAPRTYQVDTPLGVGSAYQQPEGEGGGGSQGGGQGGGGGLDENPLG